MRRDTVISALVVAALALVALITLMRSRGVQPGTPGQIPATGGQASASGATFKAAPDFEIVLYQGIAAVGGLCPPCRAEMPDFEKLHNERAQGQFFLVGVDIGPFISLGSQEEGKALLRELNITFPAGTTLDARAVRAYQILGMPTTVFITAEGKIFKKYTGLLTRGQMDTFVAELLRVSGTP